MVKKTEILRHTFPASDQTAEFTSNPDKYDAILYTAYASAPDGSGRLYTMLSQLEQKASDTTVMTFRSSDNNTAIVCNTERDGNTLKVTYFNSTNTKSDQVIVVAEGINYISEKDLANPATVDRKPIFDYTFTAAE